jgi:hypothetical protein
VQLALCNQNQNKKFEQISTDLPVQNIKSFIEVAKTYQKWVSYKKPI